MDLIITLLLVNALRAEPLVESDILDARAEIRAEYLCKQSQWSHEGWVESFKDVPYQYAGENLAINFSDSLDVEHAWMASPEHKANIMNREFREVGFGMASGMYEGKPTTFVVQMFGTPVESGVAIVPVGVPKKTPKVVA